MLILIRRIPVLANLLAIHKSLFRALIVRIYLTQTPILPVRRRNIGNIRNTGEIRVIREHVIEMLEEGQEAGQQRNMIPFEHSHLHI
jgi:hypothetical protein